MSVTDIPADLVKRLRDETGAGMMDCKRALEETNGDFDAAKRLLRERGIAAAGKKAGRETTDRQHTLSMRIATALSATPHSE